MAAPNESRILARVRTVERSAQWPDKWEMELEVVSSERVDGPNFARAGQRVHAFTFGPEAPAQPSDTIRARAEYIGGPRGGQFKLADVVVQSGQDQLEGTIRFQELPRAFHNATTHVVVEDVSRADGPSRVVVRHTVDGVSAEPGQSPVLRFSLPLTSLEPRRSYSVSVHVDVDGDGSVSGGDYITMESHPVTRESSSIAVTVRLVSP